MKWKYSLKQGVNLRAAIRSDDCVSVVRALKASYDELRSKHMIDDYDYERYTEGFEIYGEDLDEDTVNYELSSFYDLCDELKVWITI